MTATCAEAPTATLEWLATRPLVRLRLDELTNLQRRAEHQSTMSAKLGEVMTARAWASIAVDFRGNPEYAEWFKMRTDMFNTMRALDLKREHLKRTVAFYLDAV